MRKTCLNHFHKNHWVRCDHFNSQQMESKSVVKFVLYWSPFSTFRCNFRPKGYTCTFFYDRKKTRKKKKQCILYLVWCEKHTCRSRDSKGKQTSQSCLSSNFIFKAVKRCSLVLRTRSVKEYVFPWTFLQDDSKTIWFPFENSRPGVDAVVPFNLGRYKTQHIYFAYVQDVQVLNISMRSRIGIVHLRNISWRCLGGVNSVQWQVV